MLPKTLAPMLAESAEAPFDHDNWLFEIKWDGSRTLIFIEDGKVRAQSRLLLAIQHRYPELEELASLPDGTLLDGELVVLDKGLPSLAKLQKRNSENPDKIRLLQTTHPVTFVPFDLLYQDGKSLMDQPLIERRSAMENLLQDHTFQHVLVPNYVIGSGIQYFEACQNATLEGVMAKRLDSQYIPGKRVRHWQKVKVTFEDVFQVVGFTEDKEQMAALILAQFEKETWYYRGMVGTGFSLSQRQTFLHEMSQMEPGPALTQEKKCQWRTCPWQVRIKYYGVSDDGILRHPVFVEICSR